MESLLCARHVNMCDERGTTAITELIWLDGSNLVFDSGTLLQHCLDKEERVGI